MIVLHIGLRKSGSTSLQTFLASNADALRAMSVDYPEVGRKRPAAHHNIVHELQGLERFHAPSGSLADLVEHRRSVSAQTLVLSSEMFEALPPEAVARFRDALAVLGEPIRIVLIIRDLISLMPSSYAQKVRYGRKKFHFDRFFEKRRIEERVDYFATAKRWADAFGCECLKVIVLGPRLIEDFLSASGLPPEIANLPQPGVVNSASGWRVLEAMRSFHRGSHGLPASHPMRLFTAAHASPGRAEVDRQEIRLEAAARSVGEAMGWMGDKGRYMTWEQAEWCASTYDDAVAAINAHFHFDIPVEDGLASRNFVARTFLPSAALIPATDLETFYDAVGDRLMQPDDTI